MLQRHVNNHFSKTDGEDGAGGGRKTTGARKMVDSHNSSESSKNLKRAGIKLKYRHTVFSARIFDFFDVGIMAGVKSTNLGLETEAKERFGLQGDSIVFKSRVMGMKIDPATGQRSAMIRWVPEDM